MKPTAARAKVQSVLTRVNTLTSNEANASSLPAVVKNTGLAVIEIDDTTYEYTLDTKGRLVENQLVNGNWTVPDNAVVATDARHNSPIAAISYAINGKHSVRPV
jgi:hypothetical protein